MHPPDSNIIVLGENSDAAFVKVTTTPNGPSITASVPGKEAGRMLSTAELTIGAVGTAAGPYAMLRALEASAVELPWQALTAVIAIAALAPIGCLWLTIRLRG
ncbi:MULTISPECIES: hypothetical protein [unclassified Streptomyces]|uniref:hypothetical protein n=1 Tax=unclassified Streptomyces TaxID=2593676 RepID=UPI000374EA1A|nr:MULTISPECIES: hypothetical protein [unclassified Streptomyces]